MREAPESSPPRSAVFWTAWLGAAGLAAVLLAVLAPHDLAISRSLARPGKSFGWIVARFGEWPGVLAAISGLALAIAARRGALSAELFPLGAALATQALLQPLAVTQLLKLFWGRRRPDALNAIAAGYTPFYVPAGPGVGCSFPSGHAAIAAVTVAVPLDLHRRGKHLAALVAWIPCGGYPALVAWGRVVEGRHFPTDVVFSLALALLLAPLCLRAFATLTGRSSSN